MAQAIKVLPSDIAEGIERFIMHLCSDEASYDDAKYRSSGSLDERIKRHRARYEIEIRRATAHLWKHSGQKSSVAWIVLGDGLIIKADYSKSPRLAEIGAEAYFKRGDILKSATWKAPAKNFTRGNVLTDTVFPRWHWNGWT